MAQYDREENEPMEFIADYRPTAAQQTMRSDIEAEAERQPMHVSKVLDELFDKMTAQREAERRYPKRPFVDKSYVQEAFIAGAEWWAEHGL